MTNRLNSLFIALILTTASLFVPIAADEQATRPQYIIDQFGNPPAIPEGPLPSAVEQAVDAAFFSAIAPVGSVSRSSWGPINSSALEVLIAAKDPRVVWLISDLLSFTWEKELSEELANAAAQILGIKLNEDTQSHWNDITDHLIAWDIPAYPHYLKTKRAIFTNAVHGWEALFIEGGVDWRMVSWGCVPIDARAYGETDLPCSCIPAADNPAATSAQEATWLQDDDIVFGIEVNGEYRAYPRRIMEVRELVNDTLGGRQLGIPYCTLCGAAQAYFTDRMPTGVKRPILRTSGLLNRSNKVMYDIETHSIFDTFLGRAVTGPLAELELQLAPLTVITTDWGTWKTTYPETTVLAEHLALGKNFDLRNTRDADGPIFPIGDVDPRLSVSAEVIGAITESGAPVAFPRGAAFLALQAGDDVMYENVKLVLDAGGIKAINSAGKPLNSHQAFWFAWSQFYPLTDVWSDQ